MSLAIAQPAPRLTCETPIQYLKGVGPYIAELLSKRTVYTAWDLLFYLPFKYVDRRKVHDVRSLPVDKKQTLLAEVVSHGVRKLGQGGRRIFEMAVRTGADYAVIAFFQFHEAGIVKRFPIGARVLVHGDVKSFRGMKSFAHPDIEIWDEDDGGDDPGKSPAGDAARVYPFYHLTEGLHQKTLRRVFEKNLEALLDLVEEEPRSVRENSASVKISLREAFDFVHRPPVTADIDALNERRSPQHQRLIYDEFFYLQLGLIAKRYVGARQRSYAFGAKSTLYDKAIQLLPFTLTNSQNEAIADIRRDFLSGSPMNRLLQGDVGSGKTMVAFLTALIAAEEGLQTAIMAPTEILAEQHFRKILPFEDKLGIRVELLTSSTPEKRRREILGNLKGGLVNMVVGTHALLTADVRLAKLGYVVIDEQHRFGVLQRAELKNKTKMEAGGIVPHLLVMTATPIPRTLSMTVYGDLDVSIMRELPGGRQPITTKVSWETGRAKVYEAVTRELKKGAQAYFVYPLVEESEKLNLKHATGMFEELKKTFPDYRVGLLHGRLDGVEKDAIMRAFTSGDIRILAATTVVEVGVDIANATVMVIEHAERFGLSQLHQLRGRVGRGSAKSYCFLIAGYARSEESRFRLRIMEQTTDGFVIAEEDLKLRGPGDFMGTKQSGLPDFRLAELVRDGHLLNAAKKRATEILANDADLIDPRNARLKNIMLSRWGKRLDLLLA